jgi:hypothetical protein
LFTTTGYGKRLLKVFKRVRVVEYLKGDPTLQGDGGQVGSVLSPHIETLMKLVEMWKKERVGLLLLRYPVL